LEKLLRIKEVKPAKIFLIKKPKSFASNNKAAKREKPAFN